MEKIDNFGLTTSQVQERIDNGQVNVSHDNISKTKKQIVMEHTLTYFNILNVFLAGIILSTGRWTNLTFMVVVIVNAVVGIYQELKVKKIIDQLTVVTVKKVKLSEIIKNQLFQLKNWLLMMSFILKVGIRLVQIVLF